MKKNVIWTIIVLIIISLFTYDYVNTKYYKYEKTTQIEKIEEQTKKLHRNSEEIRDMVESYREKQEHKQDSLQNTLKLTQKSLTKVKIKAYVKDTVVKHDLDSLNHLIKDLIEQNEWYETHTSELYQEIDVLNSLANSYKTLLDSIHDNPVLPDTIVDTVFITKPLVKLKHKD